MTPIRTPAPVAVFPSIIRMLMTTAAPNGTALHVRDAGAGPAVLCFHSNASSSSQWRSLMERLAPRFRVLAVDQLGAGKSPDWPAGTEGWLDDDLERIAPLVQRIEGPLRLVGHSYGGALALRLALRLGARVQSLALYEPTLFSLNYAASQGIRDAAGDAIAAVERGDLDAAAERFIDFWMAKGAWRAMPEGRRPAIAASMRPVRYWAHALYHDATPAAAFRELRVPVLYMVGGRSPASSLGVFEVLSRLLPNVQVVRYDQLGHMGPVTHPELVNADIERHLAGG